MQRKPITIDFWIGDLPHWQIEDGRYFVTIHLQGSIPPIGQQRIRQLSQHVGSQEKAQVASQPQSRNEPKNVKADANLQLSRKIFAEMERWLDRQSPVTHLAQNELAEMVAEAIVHRTRLKIWEMLAFVIMPSHLHMFFELAEHLSLKQELSEFERWTGHQATKIDSRLSHNRFWQTEWFDHWSRSGEEDDRIVRYIHDNPFKAGLIAPPNAWPYSG